MSDRDLSTMGFQRLCLLLHGEPSTWFTPYRGYKLVMASRSDGGQMTGEKDLTEVDSSSVTSKTVSSFVICNRERTLFVRFSSFSSPPWLRMLVNAHTNSPSPELSM